MKRLLTVLASLSVLGVAGGKALGRGDAPDGKPGPSERDSERTRLLTLQAQATGLLTQAAETDTAAGPHRDAPALAAKKLEARAEASVLTEPLREELRRAARELRGRPRAQALDTRPYLELLGRARAQLVRGLDLG